MKFVCTIFVFLATTFYCYAQSLGGTVSTQQGVNIDALNPPQLAKLAIDLFGKGEQDLGEKYYQLARIRVAFDIARSTRNDIEAYRETFEIQTAGYFIDAFSNEPEKYTESLKYAIDHFKTNRESYDPSWINKVDLPTDASAELIQQEEVRVFPENTWDDLKIRAVMPFEKSLK